MWRTFLILGLVMAPVILAAPIDLGEGKQPQIAVSASNEILVTYGKEKSILFTRSTDGGKTFAPPVTVAEPKFTPLGMRRGPRIVATKNSICIAAVAGEKGGGKDGDVSVWRSTDEGKTWTASRRLNHIPAAAREGLIGMASDGDARVFVVWLDLRSYKTEIFGALSTDGGLIFGDDMPIYRSPDGHVCECCQPSCAFDGAGDCFVMFRNFVSGNRDMYVARSRDNGLSFESATRLGDGQWKLNGCPMDGGGIIASGIAPGDHAILTAWQRNGQIFTAGSSGAETSIAPGRQPAIAMSGEAISLTWIDPKGRLMFRRGESDPRQLAAAANFPVLISNRAGHLICAWESANHCYVEAISSAP